MYNVEQKERMIMKKQKSYKGWDFLDACTSEQLNLLKEVLFIDDKKRISIDLTDGEWKRMERKVGQAEIIKALSGMVRILIIMSI